MREEFQAGGDGGGSKLLNSIHPPPCGADRCVFRLIAFFLNFWFVHIILFSRDYYTHCRAKIPVPANFECPMLIPNVFALWV